MRTFLRFLIATIVAVISGMGVSMATGIQPFVTLTTSVIISHIILPFLANNTMFSAVVLVSAWENELIKSIKTIKDDFLARIPDKSNLVGNNVINLTKIGVKPNVLIDNNTYPIEGGQREDSPVVIQLRKLTTEYTIITADELYALPYDKKGSVIEQHKLALVEEFRKIALHSFSPTTNSSTTPVLETTGDDDGTGRKRLKKEDLIKFRRKLNDIGVGACDLVLCNEHVEDILLWSEAFVNQYQAIASGMVVPMFGFYISQNQGYAPSYNTGTKKAFGAAVEATDVHASVAYPAERMFKAYGQVEMFYSTPEPKYQQHELNFNAYFAAAPKDSTGTGALISALIGD